MPTHYYAQDHRRPLSAGGPTHGRSESRTRSSAVMERCDCSPKTWSKKVVPSSLAHSSSGTPRSLWPGWTRRAIGGRCAPSQIHDWKAISAFRTSASTHAQNSIGLPACQPFDGCGLPHSAECRPDRSSRAAPGDMCIPLRHVPAHASSAGCRAHHPCSIHPRTAPKSAERIAVPVAPRVLRWYRIASPIAVPAGLRESHTRSARVLLHDRHDRLIQSR